jgi:hypothetical protein
MFLFAPKNTSSFFLRPFSLSLWMRVGLFDAGASKKISALYSPKPANREKWEASVDGKCLGSKDRRGPQTDITPATKPLYRSMFLDNDIWQLHCIVSV